MPVNVRMQGDVVILSNFARLLNDPRHFDAAQDVQEIIDQGFRKFVMDLAGIREMGSTSIGLFTTITRRIRQSSGEVVLANLNSGTKQFIEEMQLDEYWDAFESIDEAVRSLKRSDDDESP
jgi:anti-anti-sigma factor